LPNNVKQLHTFLASPAAVSVELKDIVASPPTFNLSVLMANALAAFALNLAVFLLIGKTSALTMNIAGVIKDWMLIFFSYHIFHAPVTRLNLIGYVFCCTGVAVYNYQKLLVGLKLHALNGLTSHHIDCSSIIA
jgi:hypothetical protein